MSTRTLIISILIGFMLAGMPCSGQINADKSLTLQEAIEQLDDAIEQAGSLGAEIDVNQAAAVLSFVLDRDGIDSSEGHLALGNAYFIGNDLGRAILHYRRGLLIDPSNQVLKQNLDHARSFVEPTVPSEGKRVGIQAVLLSWHRVLDRWTLWIMVVGAFAISSILWTGRSFGLGTRIPLKVPAAIAALALIGFALLGFDQWTMDHGQGMVVTTPGAGMYSGPGTRVYQEVYDGALGVGTEAVVLDTRENWVQIRLNNAQEGWIFNQSIEMVRQ